MTIFKTVILFVLVFTCGNLFAQDYTLTGRIKGIDSGWAYVRHRQTDRADSGRILNGKFVVSGILPAPEFCAFGLRINGAKDYYFGLFLEKGQLTINADKDSLNDISVVINGSAIESEFQQFQLQVKRVDHSQLTEIQAEAELEKISSVYALNHPDSYVSAFALISYENDLSKLAKLYEHLSADIQQSYYGKVIKDRITRH